MARGLYGCDYGIVVGVGVEQVIKIVIVMLTH